MPNTSSPIAPSAPAPTAAMVPETSWPGMAWRRLSPDLVCVVGCHNSSVWVTPTAWTRINTSPRPGCRVSTSALTSPGTGRESSHRQTFILHLLVRDGRWAVLPPCCHLLHGPGTEIASFPPLAPFAHARLRSRDILLQQVDGHGEKNDILHQEPHVAFHRWEARRRVPAVGHERDDG